MTTCLHTKLSSYFGWDTCLGKLKTSQLWTWSDLMFSNKESRKQIVCVTKKLVWRLLWYQQDLTSIVMTKFPICWVSICVQTLWKTDVRFIFGFFVCSLSCSITPIPAILKFLFKFWGALFDLFANDANYNDREVLYFPVYKSNLCISRPPFCSQKSASFRVSVYKSTSIFCKIKLPKLPKILSL